jgi:hypothetical protein
MKILERVFQVAVFVIAAFMIWGGGFFWRQAVADNYTQTQTYTLYKSLTPPPRGPRFCPVADTGSYGLVLPCNFVPPFVWWLQHRSS